MIQNRIIQILNNLSKKKRLCLIIVFIAAILFRLPFYNTPFWRTPDAVEYINVARNIAEGKGITSTVKFTFFYNHPVITSGFNDRPILTPIIFSSILFFNKDVFSLQLFLLVIEAIDIVLLYLLARKLLTQNWAFIIALLAGLNPNLLIGNRLILSEPIYYFFVLLAFLIHYSKNKSIKKYILLGFLTGMSFLTRPEGIILLITLIIFNRKVKGKEIALIVTFFTTLSPLFIYWIVSGLNPFQNVTTFQFQVKNFTEALKGGFDAHYPTVTEFIFRNYLWIIERMKNIFYGSIFYLTELSYFGVLIFLLLFSNLKKLNNFYPIFLYSLGNIIILSITWGIAFEPQRHLGLLYLLILLFLGNVVKLSGKRLAIVIIIILVSLATYILLDAHRMNWVRNVEFSQDEWDPSKRGDLYLWINNNIPENSIMASPNPFLINLFTQRPTILLPNNIFDKVRYKKFITIYKVQYLLAESEKEEDFFNMNAIYLTKIKGISIYKVKPFK